MKKSIIFLGMFFAIAVSGICNYAFGWGEIAHLAIVRKANDDPEVNIVYLGELADAWGSQTGFLNTRIEPMWCWSHNTLITGYNNPWWLYAASPPVGIAYRFVPNEPDYADWQEPGYVMFILIHYGRIENPNDKELALATAMSFSMHNAMDHPEHFEYFLAGTVSNWEFHHRQKEWWADYVVASRGWGITINEEMVGSYEADTELIHLAQRVFVKNRRYVDQRNPVGTESTIEVLPKTAIADVLEDGWVKALDRVNDLSNWSDRKKRSYDRRARRRGWCENELEDRFNAAVERVKAVYDDYKIYNTEE